MTSTSAYVTIILPTYRRPDLLRRAIASVQAQTFPDFHLLVCDNASGDGTADLVAEMARQDPRIRLQIQPQNLGAQANFAWGLSQVETPYFGILSDDDLLLPRHLELLIAGLEAHPAMMAWAGRVLVVEQGIPVASLPPPSWPTGPSLPHAAARWVACDVRPQNTGMLFRRTVLDGNFHPVYTDFHGSDVLWTLHAAMKGGIGLTDDPVALFIRHAGSLSSHAGTDVARALEVYWPSVTYLLRHLPDHQDRTQVATLVQEHYGRRQLIRLGRLAAARGMTTTLTTCIQHLRQDLGNAEDAARLERLRRLPAPLLRAWFAVIHRLSHGLRGESWQVSAADRALVATHVGNAVHQAP